MSLPIILDKSSFQMLNIDEIVMLHNYFLPNITPILVMEVLGDLKKEEKEGATSKEKVIQLAKKLLPHNSAVNIYYPKLIEIDLKGENIKMDNRPIVGEITAKESSTGQQGFHIKDSAEEIALGKWKIGQFTTVDELTAQLWREITTKKDILENLKEQLKKTDAGEKKVTSLDELKIYVDELLNNPENQINLLHFCITEFAIDPAVASEVFGRWEQQTEKKFSSFAPYAFYCCRVKLLFYLGLKHNLIGTRATNHVDLQYLYYLPFCLIFTSNDNFHKSFVKLLLGEKHTFIIGEDLKKDLKQLVSYRETLSEKKDIERTLKEPPRIDSSLIYGLWAKYYDWPPRFERKVSGKEMEDAKRKMDEFIDAKDAPGNKEAVKDPDFITKEYEISEDDLCPCGSGKKFKDCHLKIKS